MTKFPPELTGGQIFPTIPAPWCVAINGVAIPIQVPIVACEDFSPSAIKAEDRLKVLEAAEKGKSLPRIVA
jgi:hypothetical protein